MAPEKGKREKPPVLSPAKKTRHGSRAKATPPITPYQTAGDATSE